MSNRSRMEKTALITGSVFIVLGILGNEMIIARLFSQDGILTSGIRVLIWLFDFIAIGLGIIIILKRRNRQFLFNLMLLFVSLSVAQLAIEVIASQVFRPPRATSLPLCMPNPNGAGPYRLRPNLYFKTKSLNRHSKEMVIRTNSHGMRWFEVDLAKPAGKRRIAFVGDSFTFGSWADRTEDSFVGIVHACLDSTQYEVLNFGVPGYGYSEIELQLKESILGFDVDVLVLATFYGNDFTDTYLGCERYRVIQGVPLGDLGVMQRKIPAQYLPRRYFQDPTPRNSTFLESRVFYKMIIKTASLLSGRKDKRERHLQSLIGNKDEFTGFSFWSRKIAPDIVSQAKDVSLDVLERIRRICADHDIKLVIVTIPYELQIVTDSLVTEYFDFNYPQEYIHEYCRLRGIPYLDLLPILREHVRESKEAIFVTNDYHLNNHGHRIIGLSIAEFLMGDIFSHPSL
jgi:hypothetical protein